jgi:ankyrin repeat protein
MSDVKAFHESVKAGDLPAVEAALAADPALLDATNDLGQSAFLLSKYYRQEQVAAYLLSRNPSLDIFNLAVAGRTAEVLRELDRDPALLETHSSDGWTPLHLAVFFAQPQLAAALIERGANIESRSTNAMKNTPLHAAAAGGSTQLVDLLLKHGADVNARQEGGWTALHSAAQSGNRAMVESLLAHDAKVDARAANNQSPLDLALLKGHQDVASLLEGLGATLL